MNMGVSKGTNTTTTFFDDLGAADSEAQNFLTVNKKLKSSRPRDNDSFASSASKNSKQIKNVVQAVKLGRHGKDDEQNTNQNIKKSLASLSEEDSSIKGGPSGEFGSPAKIGKFSRGKSRGSNKNENKLMSPDNNSKNLMSSMHHITQSMDYGNVDNIYDDETGLDKNGRPMNANPRSRQKKRTNSNASTPRNRTSDKKNILETLGEMTSIPEAQLKNQKKKDQKAYDYKPPTWSISQKGAGVKAERLTITLLKSISWKPKSLYSKGKMDSVVYHGFQPWGGKSSNEDIISMQASGNIRSNDKEKSKDKAGGKSSDDKEKVHTVAGIQGISGKPLGVQVSKEKQSIQDRQVFKENSRKLKDELGSATEYPRNTNIRNDTEDSFFRSRVDRVSRPFEGEEHTTLKTIQENTATNLTWNLKKQVKRKGQSLENERNKTYHGSLPKPHLDLENPYTKQPTKYLDHLEDSNETIKKPTQGKIANFIDHKLKVHKKKRDRNEDLHTRLYQDGIDAANEKRIKKLAYEEGAAQDWEDHNLRKQGVLCRN